MSLRNGQPEVFTATLTTADTNAVDFSPAVPCRGATGVNLAVSATGTTQLSAGVVRMTMTDGKVIDLAPSSLGSNSGADATTAHVNAIGGVTVQDLSNATNHRDITLRSKVGGTDGPYGLIPVLPGVDLVTLRITQAAAVSNTYTLVVTVYY